MKQPLLSFNNGEVSPYLRHRTDFEKTGSSAELVENFVCTPYGAITKRPGIQFLANSPLATVNSRLFPFITSDGSRYLLLFTEDLLTILRPDGTTADTIPFLTFVSPDAPPSPAPAGFYSAPLRKLQIAALNDVLFITHPDSHPMRLSRITDTNWTLEFLPFTRAPLLDPNEDESLRLSVFSNPIAPSWVTSTSYAIGDTIFHQGAEWTCRADHSSASTTEPGVGVNWTGSWRRKLYSPGEAVTISPINARIGDFVRTFQAGTGSMGYSLGPTSGNRYYCAITHTPTRLEDAPVGHSTATWKNVTNWTFYFPGSSVIGQYVRNVGNLYVATAAVVLNGTHAPGTGANWTSVFALVISPEPSYPAYDAFPNSPILTGTYVSHLGNVWRALADVTPELVTGTIDGLPVEGAEWTQVDSFFDPLHAGSSASPGTTFQISPRRDERDFQIELAAITANDGLFSQPITVQGNWNVNTFGTWAGTFNIQRSSDDGDTWETIRSYEAKSDRNISDSGEELSPVLLRLGFIESSTTAGSGTQRAVLAPALQSITGYALADTYVNGASMTGTATTALMSGLTSEWAEGAFSGLRGFPAALALHESRLAFAGTSGKPVSLWLSQTEDFLNFQTGSEDTDGIFATLAAPNQYPIRWLASQRRLFLGTSNALWVVGSETSDASLAPSNFNARLYTSTGSDSLQPVLSSDSLFFLDRKGARLHQLNFSEDIGSYEPTDLSRLAEHLTQPGIIGYAYAHTREPVLYLVTREGKLLMFSYSRRDNIMAWTRHTTQLGTFRDVAILPSDDGDDEVFFLIDDRAVAQGSISQIARFPQHWQEIMETGQNPNEAVASPFPWFYLDGFSVLNRNGETIPCPNALTGSSITQATVAGDGTLTLTPALLPIDIFADPLARTFTIPSTGRYQLGLPILSTYRSLPIDLPSGDGATHSGRKRINKVSLSLYRSRGGTASCKNSPRTIPITANDGILFNGWADTVTDAGHYDDAQLTIQHSEPYPFTVRAALIEMQITQR